MEFVLTEHLSTTVALLDLDHLPFDGACLPCDVSERIWVLCVRNPRRVRGHSVDRLAYPEASLLGTHLVLAFPRTVVAVEDLHAFST